MPVPLNKLPERVQEMRVQVVKSPSGEESFHSLVQLLRRRAFLLLECGTKSRRGEGDQRESPLPEKTTFFTPTLYPFDAGFYSSG